MTPSFVHDGVTYVLRSPEWLWLALLLPLFGWALRRSLAGLRFHEKALSLLLKAAFVLALLVGLGRVARESRSEKVCTVFLVDVSDSMTDEAIADAQKLLDDAWKEKREDDVLRLVAFGARPQLVPIPDDAQEPPRLARLERGLSSGTHVQAAMQLAQGLYPPGHLRRMVLVSDGIETEGDMLAEAHRLRELGIKLFTFANRRPGPREIAVRELRVPDRVKVGEPFELRADVYASQPGEARLRLVQGEMLNGLDGIKTVELAQGSNEIVFRSVVRVPGEVRYELRVEPITEDTFADNNHFEVTIDVPGRPAVLYVEGEPSQAGPLARALESQGFEVDVRGPLAFPASLKELERFDFLVLSDVPAKQIPESAQALIERYLREVGGGFLFAGGPNGYGPGGWQNSTVERLLPVRARAEKEKEMPTVALALVIDRSGSMSGLPMEMAKEAAKATVDTLAPDDRIGVIVFDSAPVRAVKMQPARNRSRIKSDISRIQAGGGTEIFPALDAAYQDLAVTEARRKHVILLTDGRAPSSGIRDLVQAMAAEAITVTTVGLGPEVDDGLLTTIKDYGGGRYHKVPNASSLPRIFTREAEMVAKSATTLDYFPVQQTSPASFLRGIDVSAAPFLSGYTSTGLKPPPAQQILANPDHGEPVLARWRVGLGWSLAWTSDVKARWAADWARWAGWPKFWGQLVREHMRQRHGRELPMQVEIVGGEVRAAVDAYTPDDRFENGLTSTLVVVGRQPGEGRREVPMRQTAPGRYEARFRLDQFGAFVLRAEHTKESEDGRFVPYAVSHGHVAHPYPREYASFEADVDGLDALAEATSGAPSPKLDAIYDPAGESVVSDEELWPRFVLAAIALLVLDLFVRRVRIFA